MRTQKLTQRQEVHRLALRVAELEADLAYARLTPSLPLSAGISWVRLEAA